MKINNQPIRFLLFVFMVLAIIPAANSQVLKKLKKAAERTVERKLEDKTVKETGKVMDTLLNNGNKNSGTKSSSDKSAGTNSNNGNSDDTNESGSSQNSNSDNGVDSEKDVLEMYSKSDWMAGKKLLLFEDFSSDPIGDFPQLWNTNSSGEVVTITGSDKKWLKLFNNGVYQPDLPKDLPQDYTIEFDLKGYGIDNSTGYSAELDLILGDGTRPLNRGRSYVMTNLPIYQQRAKNIIIYTYNDGSQTASGNLTYDIRKKMANGCHVAISVKGQRYRFYIDGKKIADFPRGVASGKIKTLLFSTAGFKNEEEHLLISNLRIAEGLPGSNEKIFTTGKFVTDAIQFDINSAQIRPESYSILRQIAEAVKAESGKKVLIIGHTDSDGEDAYNLDLSKKRAAAVKEMLVDEFNIPADRLSTDGKGEGNPIAPNDNSLNKAKNRRTEFIIQ